MPPTWCRTRLCASSTAQGSSTEHAANARTWRPSPAACAWTTGAGKKLEQAWLQQLALQPEALQPSPEQRAVIVETLHEVDAMLLRLPSKVRQAFLLAQIDGLAYRDIAAHLGVSERMIKKYLAQAFLHCAILEAELDGLLVE